jgi:hypothetical protein
MAHWEKHNHFGGVTRWLVSLVATAVALGGSAGASDSQVCQRRILVCGKQAAIVAFSLEHPEGVVEWSYPVNTREGWVLPDGNVLLAVGKGSRLPDGDVVSGGAAIEIRRGAGAADSSGDRIVWRYDGTQAEVNSIQKTADGTYVLTEAGPNPRLLEITADGTVKTEFVLACQKPNTHMQTRMARKQADGTFLVPHLLDFTIVRYAADGTVLSKIDTHVPGEPTINSWPFTAIALADGGILAGLTNGNRVVEFDANGAIRWQVTAAETDGAINDACGVQRLPNGNTIIASYRIGKGGERMLEVSPDKKVVWAWQANVPAVHHFHLFESDGKPVPFPALR